MNSGTRLMQVPTGVLQAALAVARSASREVMPEDLLLQLIALFPDSFGLEAAELANIAKDIPGATPIRPSTHAGGLSRDAQLVLEAAVSDARGQKAAAIGPAELLAAIIPRLSPAAEAVWNRRK